MKLLRRALSIGALASGLVLVTSSTAMAATLIPGTTAYQAICNTASDNSLTGRTYNNAEVEPQVAVHGSTAIAMFHQDRKSNGGAHGIGVGYSSDGGASWTTTTITLNACGPGSPDDSSLANMFRASDPWVSIGPDGIAYASALSFNISVPNNANAVVAARSTNGGATWDHIHAIPGAIFQTANQSTDKNSTTADPTKNKTAYTVWDTLIGPTDNPDDNPHAQAYTGPAYFSKTTDGGKTWSQAQVIINTGNRQQTIGNIIVVDPRNDTLYDFAAMLLPPNTPFQGTRSNTVLAFVKSTDGGDTWTQPQIVAPFNSLGVINPNNPAQRARVGDGLEEVAIDPQSGQLYVVYESSTNYQKQLKQSSGAWDDEIMFTTSTNGGATWSTPKAIHTASGLPTFTPTVAVNGGRVAVTYYDNRNLVAGSTHWATDYFVEYSSDGGTTWGSEQHIAGSFDLTTAPVARGFFLGDYEGLQPSGSGFLAVFVKTNCDAPYPASNPLCAPASSNTTPTTNTNPNDVFSAALS